MLFLDQPQDGAALQRLLSAFQAPCVLPRRKCTLWGQPAQAAPALLKQRFGNGQLLLGFSSVLHKPHYYLVWVDSSWYGPPDSSADEILRSHLDQITGAIEDEFGMCLNTERRYDWPKVDPEDGYSWWKANPDDVLSPHQRRARNLPQ